MSRGKTVSVTNRTTRRLRLRAKVDGKPTLVQLGGQDDAGVVGAPQPVQAIDATVWAILEKQRPVKSLLEQGVLAAA